MCRVAGRATNALTVDPKTVLEDAVRHSDREICDLCHFVGDRLKDFVPRASDEG